jgi:NADPH:quinone reductase-like Zn-dependent oxidoreductase
MMQAIVMTEFGPPEVLTLDRIDEPKDRPGWVRVRVDASALNWHDVLVRRGVYGSPLPHVIGADGAGVRCDTGEQVVIFPSLAWGPREAAPAPGWQILGDHVPGTYAEQVIVPAECVVARPPGFSLAQAAAFSLVGVTAFRALFTRGRLTAGESLLVLGASGGVATAAVQLATAVGAPVVVTSGSAEKISAACALGALGGVHHTTGNWVNEARALTAGGDGFDVVLDPVGRWAEAVAALRPGGRCVVLGASAGDEARLDVRRYYFGQFDLLGTAMGSPRDMEGLCDLMTKQRVSPPVIDQIFGLEQAADAHRRLESGDGFGKIVLLHG